MVLTNHDRFYKIRQKKNGLKQHQIIEIKVTKVAIFRYNNASCPKTTDFSQGKDDHKQKKWLLGA